MGRKQNVRNLANMFSGSISTLVWFFMASALHSPLHLWSLVTQSLNIAPPGLYPVPDKGQMTQ